MQRFITCISIITFVSLTYVHQQIKLLESSYKIHYGQHELSLLVDQNRHLRYNVNALEAPARLENIMIAQKDEVYMPRVWHNIAVVENVPNTKEVLGSPGPLIKAGKVMMSMFLLDSEAVAKELNE